MARVLIVDDLIEIAERLKFIFEDLGYEVDLSHNGREALRRLKCHRYDLVITDIVMPEVDGLELSRYIRESRSGLNSDVPIIAMSAGACTIPGYIALSAARQHANAVLPKPFSDFALSRAVHEVMGNRLSAVA